MKLTAYAALLSACALGQSMPQIGEMLDVGSLRPLYGVAGNFILGPPREDRVLSSACSAQLCLAKTDSEILSPTGRVGAPAGPALITVQGDNALVYFQWSQALVRWHDNELDPLQWNVKGTPLSIRARTDGINVAVRRGDQVWISRSDGAAVARVPGATGPVMLLDDGILLVNKQSLVLQRANVPELRFNLAGVDALSPLGENYVQVGAQGVLYALYIEPGREQLFLLPGNPAMTAPKISPASAVSSLPILDFGPPPLESAQQRTLTMSLPSPSLVTATGLVSLTFQPDSTLIVDDPFVTFLTPVTRTLTFSVKLGSTLVTINGHANAVFQTGATSGRLLFTLTGYGNSTTSLTIPASAISMDIATATRLPGEMDVSLIGFDNTLSAGSMTFTFRDANGLSVASAIQSDFTTAFTHYFSTAADGAFQALVAFSVKGDAASIASVDVDLANKAGTTSQHLIFH